MSKKIIFSLLFFLLSTKSLSADLNFTRGKSINVGTDTPLACLSDYFVYRVIEREIIEWRTISKTIPVHAGGGNCIYLGYNTTLLNQVGTKYLVTFAQIEWKGKTKEFELERTIIKSDTVLERTIQP